MKEQRAYLNEALKQLEKEETLSDKLEIIKVTLSVDGPSTDLCEAIEDIFLQIIEKKLKTSESELSDLEAVYAKAIDGLARTRAEYSRKLFTDMPAEYFTAYLEFLQHT